jgi:ribosomal protein S18 acetylase RimI-like enzyme
MNLRTDQASTGDQLASRFYASENDLQQMYNLLMDGRALTGDWRYWHVGELAFNYFMVACHLDPCRHIRLWHDGDKLVAFAILGEDPAFDFQVLPGYDGSGYEDHRSRLYFRGDEALTWAQALVVELRQQDAGKWGGDLVSASRQDDARRIAFLERIGFRYCGNFAEVNMLRSLDETIPEPAVPDGYQVREVLETGELSSRAAAQREVWQPWTVGNVSDEDYARFMRMPGYHRFLDIVTVTPDGVIAAYVNGWIDPINQIGDFGPVGALPAYRRQGLTRLALLEGLRRMKACGMDRVCVSTGVTNTPARRLYESIGFQVVNKTLDYVKAL